MNVTAFVDALAEQGTLLGSAARRAGLAAAVPTCPGWTVRDLLWHVGGIHRWSAMVVGEARTEPIDVEQPYDVVEAMPADADLFDWYEAGHAALVNTLAAAPAELACWQFMPAPSPLAFWARRQAHETAIHRLDAESAAGRRTAVRPELAEDGIDELLTCFVSGRNRRLRAEEKLILHVHAADVDAHWVVTIGPDQPLAERVGADAVARLAPDTTLRGRADLLYPALWNRAPLAGLTVLGLPELANLWQEKVHIRWS